MAADLTGIENVGEFFSQHYLDELLVGDLGEIRARWRETPGTAPDAALRALGREFAKAHAEASQHTQERALWECSHGLQVKLAEALGYAYQAGAYVHLPDRQVVPVLSVVERRSEPYLVVLEGRFSNSSEGALDLVLPAPIPRRAQDEGLHLPRQNGTLSGVMTQLFALEAPPRWVLLFSGANVFLAERARWGRGQYLRFDLAEILGRRDATAVAVTAALLAKETLAPADGAPLHDRLDEQSHKHAHGVSKDLKYAAREAVELIGNEWVHHQRTIGKKALYGERVARELTEECLTFLYRLLFLFYAEARAEELQSLPMNAEEYARGYSLEALRELEQVPLTTPEARDGTFFHESIERLFRLVNEGHTPFQTGLRPKEDKFVERGFALQGLGSPLFDPKATPRLSAVRFRNSTLQRVIRLLSLSQEGRRGRGRAAYGRGRISYTQLGINQLGAVYEGLLSYTGFFAKETLYEVHPAGEKRVDETQQAFFVPESELARYSDAELGFEEADGSVARRKYAPGTFIFRLAGRDRETSASYYTPEVLTRCLVKYSLKELLEGKTADEILGLRICEPAMGSGAFLVEAVDQLADAYLERKQHELGQTIPPDRYAYEKQRVKTHLAVHCAYGVDLNPMAARLAGVSLWLATMHQGQEVPWFEPRLAVGNSLVGARLEVYAPEDLETDQPLAKELAKVLKKHGESSDLESEIEKRCALVEKSAPDAVAALRRALDEHRLGLNDQDSGDGEDGDVEEPADERPEKTDAERRAELVKALKKVAKEFSLPRHHRKPPTRVPAADVVAGKRPPGSIYHFLLPDQGMSPFDKDKAVAEIVPEAVERLKAWRKKLGDPYGAGDSERLARISDQVDALFRQLATERARVLRDTRGWTPVWGQPEPEKPRYRAVAEKQKMARALVAEGGAYARLRSAMDLWAALWAWPLAHAESLPSRDAWWSEVERLLGVEGEAQKTLDQQLDLVGDVPVLSDDDEILTVSDGVMSVMGVVTDVAARLRPVHWALEVPEVFVERSGFDLIVGNPPWIKLQWNEQGILGDLDPRIVLDGLSASVVATRREAMSSAGAKAYLRSFEVLSAYTAFLASRGNYAVLEGVQANVYKCFLVRAWALGGPCGVVGLCHEDGILDDPTGVSLRVATYEHLRQLYRFQNVLTLFDQVGHMKTYCLTISSSARPAQALEFLSIANVFHPKTIDESWNHDGVGEVPGLKDDAGRFETRGHGRRLIRFAERDLVTFARLFHGTGTRSCEAALPIVHSRDELAVLERLSQHGRHLADLANAVVGTTMFDETGAQRDGLIRRQTVFPADQNQWVVSGPHLWVGNPLYKTPREVCDTKNAYDVIDLETADDTFLPRTNYVPNCSIDRFFKHIAVFRGVPVTSHPRHAHRRRLNIRQERTFASAIIPPGPTHVHTVVSFAFVDSVDLCACEGLWESLVVDFLVRATGTSDLTVGDTRLLPIPGPESAQRLAFAARALRLNCLTRLYGELWGNVWPACQRMGWWASDDSRLSLLPGPLEEWSRVVALRSAFERRQAMLELDALAALEFGLSIDELCTIYRTQFPVLRDYENNTWYDRQGRIVFTNNRGLVGVGLERKDFETWQACLAAGDPLPDGFDPKNFEPPFDRRDREEDMRVAYEFFRARLS